jgi:Zn-dependent protease with chaperone function
MAEGSCGRHHFGSWVKSFSTPPPMDKRIERLRAYCPEMQA